MQLFTSWPSNGACTDHTRCRQELFGPLSMRGLENDEYVRKIDGYLPTAEVAFIDDIFKANSAILNALLTLLNERLFDNGNQRFPVPLLCMVRFQLQEHNTVTSKETLCVSGRFSCTHQSTGMSPEGFWQVVERARSICSLHRGTHAGGCLQ